MAATLKPRRPSSDIQRMKRSRLVVVTSAETVRRPNAHGLLALIATALGIAGMFPGASHAALTTFGSTLSTPATIDTASGLNYAGQDIPTIRNGAAVLVHVAHDGADTALWNVTLSNGSPVAPAAGQVLSLLLKGCAQPAGGGPSPLTQIHFQELKPGGGGAVTVGVTSDAFDIPVCGVSGASPSTVTTYRPTNFCVTAGDYVAFNDEGGFDPTAYPSGVRYQVMGAVAGSTTASFIRNNGTNNGSTFSPGDTTFHDGFAANAAHELLLQAQLATGADASPLCGGTLGVKLPPPPPGQAGGGPSAVIHPQRDGVNHARVVKVAFFCASAGPCVGTVRLASGGSVLGSAAVDSAGHAHAKASLRLSRAALALIRSHHRRISVTVTISLAGGETISSPITLKI